MSRQQVYPAAERGCYHRIDVRPLDVALGAEIRRGDLPRTSAEDCVEIRKDRLDAGGETDFSDMDRALQTLPPQPRAKLSGLRVKHDAA